MIYDPKKLGKIVLWYRIALLASYSVGSLTFKT